MLARGWQGNREEERDHVRRRIVKGLWSRCLLTLSIRGYYCQLQIDLVKDQSSTFETHFRPKVGTDGSSFRTTVNAAYREHSRSIDGHRNVLLRQ